MRVRRAELATLATRPDAFPRDGLPEVAMVGRSNVGKSSCINRVTGHKGLARTSNRPGKTQALLFYRIDDSFYLVDLPGYGFARVPPDVKAEWGRLIEAYLDDRPSLAGLIHLTDIRHPPTADDRQMAEWIRHFRVPALVLATKADKVARGARAPRLDAIREGLDLGPEAGVVGFSATTGEGAAEVWRWITDAVAAYARSGGGHP